MGKKENNQGSIKLTLEITKLQLEIAQLRRTEKWFKFFTGVAALTVITAIIRIILM